MHTAVGALTVACPIYHDSLNLLQGSRELIEQLLPSGTEAFEIDLDSPIPESGKVLD